MFIISAQQFKISSNIQSMLTEKISFINAQLILLSVEEHYAAGRGILTSNGTGGEK